MEYVRYLSYPLTKIIPAYANTHCRLAIVKKKDIRKGDSSNTYKISLENHWGTHIDAPAHFFLKAKGISDYPAHYWIFKRPCVVSLKLKKDMLVTLDDIKKTVDKNHDLLLLKTGFGRLRGRREYSFAGPLVSPQIGVWLKENRPYLRAIGFDFVSIGSYEDRILARLSHSIFLNPHQKGRPILIIEDMDLSADLRGLKIVLALPLMIKGIDSAPATILGVFGHKERGRK